MGAVSSNGENGNTLKVKNGENPGMTTTTKSKSKGDSDWLTTEEEILTFSLFKLYAYILTVCLVVMSFSIWIMWFRYGDVISAVHGSKGVLFLRLPQTRGLMTIGPDCQVHTVDRIKPTFIKVKKMSRVRVKILMISLERISIK